jgi:Fic family protein
MDNISKNNKINDKTSDSTETNNNEVHALRELYNHFIIDSMQDSLDLNLVYPETQDVQELILQVDDLKKCLDSFRPFHPEQLRNLEEVFDIEYTYNSNRIEGNTLTLGETALVIQKGMTICRKSLREHFEVINHKDAFEYIKEVVSVNLELNEKTLLRINEYILQGIDRYNAGFYRRVPVYIKGSRHVPPNYMKILNKMSNYFAYYESIKNKQHPILLASEMHQKLVNIHPFSDGNGRTSRLVMNFIILKHGYPIAIISGDKSNEYYDSLELAHTTGDLNKFHAIVLNEVKRTSFRFLAILPFNGFESEHNKGKYFFEKIKPFIQK